MPITNTQEVYEIRSISPVHINPSIMEGRFIYPSILGPDRAISIVRYAPIFLVNPVLSGSAGIPNTLYCSPGVVDASPSSSRHYQWYIDDVPDQAGIGPEFTSFETNEFMDSKTITCVVTATNVLGSAQATSNGIFVTLIEPVIIGEYHFFGLTGLPADESVTVFQDQIAVTTGMWVDEFLSAFEGDVFAISGMAMEEHIGVDHFDVYAASFMSFLADLTFTNPGAESDLTGWTTTAGTLRAVTAPTVSGGGTKVFRGANAINVTTTFEQVISIPSDNNDEIDAGKAHMTMSFYTSQFGNTDRQHSVRGTFQFLDVSDVVLSSHDPLGYVIPNNNVWNLYQTSPENLPVGTRKVKIIFDLPGQNVTGGNLCQIDQIALKLYQTT